jgi:hypothetical protein
MQCHVEMLEAVGGKGFFVEDPKHIRGALGEATNHQGPALVNIVLSQGSARRPQWSSRTRSEGSTKGSRHHRRDFFIADYGDRFHHCGIRSL